LKTRKLPRFIAYIIVFIGVMWTILPLYWMVITSLKPTNEVFQNPPTFWIKEISWDGFSEAWNYGGARGLQHSSIIAVGTLIVSLSLGVPAAYAIARFRTGGNDLPFVILSFRFMPPIAPAVGFWIMANRLEIFDTHRLLILVNSMATIPFVVWIMKGFIEEIPYAIEEAAQVDGASWFRVIKDHVLPLASPGLVAVSLFVLIFTWNEFLFANLLTGRHILTFPKAVPGMTIGVLEPHWGAIMALGMMVVVPIVLLSFYMQKYIVRGMSYGAIRE
jgi:ABC-type glycerol-3-phosphate transport system permease component